MKISRALGDWAWHGYVNGVAASWLVPRAVRWRLLRRAGVEVERSSISAGCLVGSRRVTIGAGTFVNAGVLLDGTGRIVIGRRCALAMGVRVLTGSHELGAPVQRAGAVTAATTVIGDGAWIGAGATILPGVTVGPGCVVAAGSLVTHDCEADGLYQGVPARRVRELAAPDPFAPVAAGAVR